MNQSKSPLSSTADLSASTNTSSLDKRMRKGGSLSLVGFAIGQAIRLASNLIMVRLLTPDAFGLLAIAVSLQVLMIMVSDLGLTQSVIRSKNSNEASFLNTAWTVQIIRGGVLAVGLVLAAIAIAVMARLQVFNAASIFQDPRLPGFVLACAGIMALDGLRSIKFILCQRDIALGRVIGLEIGSQLIGMAVMFIAYYLGAGPYSLLANMISAAIAMVIGSHVILPGPSAKIGFHKPHFSEMFHYGKWIMLASFFGFLIQRGDQFIFGNILDKEQFGLYAIATIWIAVAIALVEKLHSRVAYPALAEMWRENPSELRPLYEKLRLINDGLCLAIFLGIIFLGDFFFGFLYPESYGGLVVYLHLLSIIILFLPYRMLNTVILAEGKSRNFLTLTIGPMILLIGGTPIVYALTDVKTAILFSTFSQVASFPLAWIYASKFMKLSPVRELPMAILSIIAVIYLYNMIG